MNFTQAQESAAAEALNKVNRGIWCERQGAGWGVYCGSHGGHGPTLRKAMKEALRCCNIGKWWKADDGRLIAEHFAEISERHLGGWQPRWKMFGAKLY